MQEAVGIVGVAGRVEHVEAHALDLELVAFGDAHRDHVGLGLLAHHGDAMGAVAQRAEPGDVVGVQMRVDRLDQLEIELADELQIAVDLLEHRIDDQRLAAAPAGEQIGVGAGDAVEELAEDHFVLRSGGRPRRPSTYHILCWLGRLDRSARGLATSRAHSMKICATGLMVRFFKRIMPTGAGRLGNSTGSIFVDSR